MPDPTQPPTEFYQPASFRGRGVAVPFTTPMLAGARVREAKDVELVVPNLSGSRGIYVLQWPGVREFCKPTVHDTILYQHIAVLPRIDPASVRSAALDVAKQGYAGRGAAAAAEAITSRDRSHGFQACAVLTARLLRQAEPDGQDGGRLAGNRFFDAHAVAMLRRMAPAMGCSVNELEDAVAAVSRMFAPIGVAVDDRVARVPRLIDRLKETCVSLSRWVNKDPGNDIVGLGLPLVATIKATCDASEAVLAATRTTLIDPATLLKRWFDNPDGVLATASRCDWLLDGWERVCLLWLVAHSTAARRASLLEMAQVLPALPTEVEEWTEMSVPDHALHEACRVTSQSDSWRTGSAAFTLVQRNEMVRIESI